MHLPTAYYKVGNDGLYLALASNTPNTPLSLQEDDGSSQMKWHTESQDSGAYYMFFSFYDGSTRKLAATVTTAIDSGADVVGGTTSKHWVLTRVPSSPANVYTIVLNGYALTNKDGLAELAAYDASSIKDNQKWTFTRWQ
ncbi:hypothetical protein VNI00_003601 [Paramarasmius palmivorus]|uniref:Ricin B lectin domain-containing protein n=1 Tax=Paramarasmius palmivorus TaxID=297713 RepID=A0AAW0DPT5_9AGAR